MYRRLLVAGLAMVAVLGISACKSKPESAAAGSPQSGTATATPTGSASASPAPAATTSTTGSTPASPPRTNGAPPPAASSSSPASSSPPTPSPGLTPSDKEACNAARYANTLLVTLIQPLSVLYGADVATDEQIEDARRRIANTLEEGGTALRNASPMATTPAIRAALMAAANAYAAAAGVALWGSIDEVLALFDEGNAIDAALIHVADLCDI